jgi:hypothetical protein
MTRETKLGLVVSCSFLCLLGTVLFLKLNDRGAVPPSPYAKADGSPPDLPADPVQIQVTVAPTAPEAEASGAPAAAGNNPGENRSNPVMALPGPTTPSTIDPKVMRAAVPADPAPDAHKETTPPVPAPAPAATPPAPTPDTAPSPPSPTPAPENPFNSVVPPLPSAPVVKDETPKPSPPVPDGLPAPKPDASTKDTAPAVPPAPDALPGSEAKPPAGETKPLPTSESGGNATDPEGKPSARPGHKKEKTSTEVSPQPQSALEDKNKDSKPAVPFPSPDLNTAAPGGSPEKPTTTPLTPAGPVGEISPTAAPVEPASPGTPKEPAPTAPGGWVVPPPGGSGLPMQGSGLLAPPPKPPAASPTPSTGTPSPSPAPIPGTSTSIVPKMDAPSPAPASPLPVIPSPAAAGVSPSPVPASSATGPGAGSTLAPIPAPTSATGLSHPDAVPVPDPRTTPPIPAPDPNVLLGKPMTPTGPADRYAQARPTNPVTTSSNPLLPLGASPPIAVPTPTVAARMPQVESYDEETYLWRTNDSFEAISGRFYNSKNYAQALLLFNRNHPRAAAALAKDPPALAEGQAVFIPPMRILERQYPTAIPGYKPATPAPAPDATRTSSRSLPPSPNLQYRVRQAGEMIPIIARDTLGSSDRWSEIYQLNARSFDPSRPLPVGTILSMPADARVPPENKP